MAVPTYAVAIGTAAQRFAPPRMQGRVGSALLMVTNLSQTLSIAVGAALVDTVGCRLLLAVAAVVASLAAVPIVRHPEKEPVLAGSGQLQSGEAHR